MYGELKVLFRIKLEHTWIFNKKDGYYEKEMWTENSLVLEEWGLGVSYSNGKCISNVD